jgi:hypothetical protein
MHCLAPVRCSISNAVQLAVAAGCDSIATAPPENFDQVKKLGAAWGFNHQSKTVVDDMILALRAKTIAAALAVGVGSAEACLDIVQAREGKKFVAIATFPIAFQNVSTDSNLRFQSRRQLPRLLSLVPVSLVKACLRGIRAKAIFGTWPIHDEVSKIIYPDFLPQAPANGTCIPFPERSVIGKGLGSVEDGLDAQRKGVSATKVVISL